LNSDFDVIVIGGGAAGFFAAINIKSQAPDAKVLILEKTGKLLTKVLVSGGGRCNVTHNAASQSALSKAYPRGKSFLKKAFNQFWVPDLMEWFEKRGVTLKIEDDGRMFPNTNQSETIANCFLKEAQGKQVQINTRETVERIAPMNGPLLITTSKTEYVADQVVMASGGHSKLGHLDYVSPLNLSLQKPYPSLFTFNLPGHSIRELKGLSVLDAKVFIPVIKESWQGPLLITHWGMSGPAVLVLSSICAKQLGELNYSFEYSVDWLPDVPREELVLNKSKKQIQNHKPDAIPQRLWMYLLDEARVAHTKKADELSKSEKNKLVELIKNHLFQAEGKTTFKEEFVTCGGIDLDEIDVKTMQSKQHPGFYFAGEVMDIDAITGGFNFQAAWTTAYIAAKNIALRLNEKA